MIAEQIAGLVPAFTGNGVRRWITARRSRGRGESAGHPWTAEAGDQESIGAVGPELPMTFDVGNVLLAGQDNMEALTQVAANLEHVHSVN